LFILLTAFKARQLSVVLLIGLK